MVAYEKEWTDATDWSDADHDPAQWEGSILVSPEEREALQSLLNLGLKDSFRLFPQEENSFSWWDYRTGAFRRNLGWRIDHHYLTPDLYERAKDCIIDVSPRRLPKPSDHAPVVVEF